MSALEARIKELENHLAGGDLLLGEEGEEDLMARIQKLKGGLVFLQPGGRTEIEADESRDRIEDAVCAVKAALRSGGFLPGGGSALL